ncbi:unnamed protein product [Malus baccata var. baccata]
MIEILLLLLAVATTALNVGDEGVEGDKVVVVECRTEGEIGPKLEPHNQIQKPPPTKCCPRARKNQSFILHFDNPRLDEHTKLNSPFLSAVDVIGTCNELLCPAADASYSYAAII